MIQIKDNIYNLQPVPQNVSFQAGFHKTSHFHKQIVPP